ncbi:MAG: hypothetical protein NUW22_05555 [Acidobacteria bacterium]|nr:hypothetical protein [Acidobacteriota bacterium]
MNHERTRRDIVRSRHHMYDAESGGEVAVTDLVGVHVDTATRHAGQPRGLPA